MIRVIGTLLATVVLVVGIGATGCGSTTSIEQSWTPSTAAPAGLHRVVVVMLSKDITIRRSAEDDMVQRLRQAGVDAVPGYSVLTTGEIANGGLVKAQLVSAGFDGVIAMRLVGKQQELQYVPPTFAGYWGPAWGMAGYFETETIVRVETTAYSLHNEALVYSALSKTVDPASVSSMIGSVTKTVSHAMEQQGVVAAAPSQAQPPAS